MEEKFFEKFKDKLTKVIKKKKRNYFNVRNEDLLEVADYLFNTMGCRLSISTATELYDGFDVLHHFSHDKTGTYYNTRVVISGKEKPEMNSITPITEGANWIEREMHDLFGINFVGHPDLRKLLTLNNPEIGKDEHLMRFKRNQKEKTKSQR